MSEKAKIVTLGCRLNAYESEVMRDHAQKAGLEDAIIVNTCAVTAEAERQARQTIRRLRRETPNAKIIVTGCAAQIDPKSYADMPEVDKVLGNTEKMKADSFLPTSLAGSDVIVSDIMTAKETAHHLIDGPLINGFGGKARAFVQIQQGCDHRCTFCIIPFGRGPNQSVPMGHIADQVSHLVDNGFGEVVLSGVDIASYGSDLPGKPSLGDMARRLLKSVPNLKRLRLSSLDPAAVDAPLFDLLENEPRFMPHIHLSLQAGDDMVLKRMKRRHSRSDVIELCQKMRQARPDVVFGADMIAGFPTETEEMFQNGVKIIDDCGLTFLHVFPYSARSGTPAAKIKAEPKAVRKARAAILREAGLRAEARYLNSMVGKNALVLVEEDHRGHSEHFAPVEMLTACQPGKIVDVKITACKDGKLIGEQVL